MKIKDLYSRKPESTSRCLGHLSGYNYNHMPELSKQYGIDSFYGLEEKNEKVEIKYYANYSFDSRRTWTLASVWFENQPVMIIQNAGREGDHKARFITNIDLYKEMLNYILSLSDVTSMDFEDMYDEDADIANLTIFYGHNLEYVVKY